MEQGREDPQDAAWAERAPFRRERHFAADEPARRGPLVAIVALHVLLILIAIRFVREEHRAAPEVVTIVELLPPEAAPETAIPSPPGQPRRTAPPHRTAPPSASTPVETAEPAAAQPLRLFDERGALLMPRPDDDRFDRPAPRSPPPKRRRAIDYEPTRFARYFVPDHETLGQRLVRKVPVLGYVLPGVNAPHCGTDPDHVPEECDPQRMTPDLNTLTHPLDIDRP